MQSNALGTLRRYVSRLPGKRYVALLAVVTALALLIRFSLLEYRSPDYRVYWRPWYSEIQQGGYRAFAHEFSDYNMPYLYILYLEARFFPDMPALWAVKLPVILADLLCAAFVHAVVSVWSPSRGLAVLAYTATLFAPTMVLNAAFWGQADSLYALGILASLYGLLTRRPWLVMIAFGAALAFKLQAIFLAPFLFALWLRGELAWKHVLSVPAVLLASLVPAMLAGRSLSSLLLVYWGQAGQYGKLTLLAPNLYAWLPASAEFFRYFFAAGLVLAITVTGIYVAVLTQSRAILSRPLIVEAATLCALLVPFILPKMHERYFFMAEVLSIVLAFYLPSYFYVALIINLAGFFSYMAYTGWEVVPQAWIALALLAVLVILSRRLALDLYPELRTPEGAR